METQIENPIENPNAKRPTESLEARTDEELFLRYRKAGDRRCFAQLVRRYERELYNYLRRYLGDADAAEDVFQTTFLLVHLKCEQFELGRPFRPWLYAIATNAAIDAKRRDKRHRAVSLDRMGGSTHDQEMTRLADILACSDLEPSAEVSRSESSEWVQKALLGLTEQMRAAVHLVYYQGLKYREAAEVLDVPVGTIKSRLHAAMQKLNEHWNQSHGEQGEL